MEGQAESQVGMITYALNLTLLYNSSATELSIISKRNRNFFFLSTDIKNVFWEDWKIQRVAANFVVFSFGFASMPFKLTVLLNSTSAIDPLEINSMFLKILLHANDRNQHQLSC